MSSISFIGPRYREIPRRVAVRMMVAKFPCGSCGQDVGVEVDAWPIAGANPSGVRCLRCARATPPEERPAEYRLVPGSAERAEHELGPQMRRAAEAVERALNDRLL